MGVLLFVKKNLVALVMVPVIIGGHYAWYKLQDDERLVSEEERSKLPFMKAKHISITSYMPKD